MKVLRGHWSGWSAEQTAVAVGVFDGVHRGHRSVLDLVADDALTSAVLTFDPHPVAVVAPEHAPRILTSLDRRIELFGEAGMSVVAVVAFDEEVRAMSPEEFCSEVLVGGLGAKRVIVGDDFHFGKDRAGTPEGLSRLGEKMGFEVIVVPLVGGDGGISSSTIRAAIAEGRIEEAAGWLGRNFRVTGVVVEGARRGVTIGFPTANLAIAAGMAVPGRGVYAVEAVVHGSSHPAVANIGVRPTFGGDERDVVEVHLLDFEGDLYGEGVSVDFVERIRDEMEFSGVDALASQIAADIETARRIHTS